MTLQQIYDLAIRLGVANDLRGQAKVKKETLKQRNNLQTFFFYFFGIVESQFLWPELKYITNFFLNRSAGV